MHSASARSPPPALGRGLLRGWLQLRPVRPSAGSELGRGQALGRLPLW